MTTIGFNTGTSQVKNKSYNDIDATRVVIEKPPVCLNKPDNLTIKLNSGPVPAKEGSIYSAAPKVLAELVSSGLNLLVKHEPKQTVATTEKVVEAAAKSTGTFAGKAMPVVVSSINVGITIYDSHSFYKSLKSDDSMISKALSGATVGLDLVTVAAHHIGYGKTAALASVVSIGTSLASEHLK
jgi:hypothetical protein